ncbi:MAG: hypothetical protein ABIA91_00520 [Patescibacteria group bacterium]
MSDPETQNSDYEMKKLWQQEKRQEAQEKRLARRSKGAVRGEGGKNEIQNLPNEADDNTKGRMREEIKEATKQAVKKQVEKVAKKVVKKAFVSVIGPVLSAIGAALAAIGSFLVSTAWIWVPIFLLVALTVGMAKDACNHTLTKWVGQMVFSISCDEPKAEVGGGASNSKEDDKSTETWQANGCKSTGETNAEGGSSCGGSCEDFSPTNIKSSQCSDASPSLSKLLECMKDNMGSYGLGSADIKLTSISDDHGLSKCRDNYSYQCPAGSKDPDCCFHTRGSCHYGGGTHTDGSYATDIRVLSGDKEGKLKNLVESCDGQWYPEISNSPNDHYHVSVKKCGKI